MYKFSEIIGAKLERVTESSATYVDEDDSGDTLNIKGQSLAFDKGWFVIENPHTVSGVESLKEVVGSVVIDAFSNSDEINIKFNNGAVVTISLKGDDFVGPEAASYSPKQGEIIVFN
ncbi:hypothetical protein A3759_17105 [Thalassolituus sp. HI0120]|nr:hypothetical protein A3759_17105 [Thalassolituus sp. HI0120]